MGPSTGLSASISMSRFSFPSFFSRHYGGFIVIIRNLLIKLYVLGYMALSSDQVGIHALCNWTIYCH